MTSKSMPNIRVLVITDKAVYNIPVGDFSVLKRRIPIDAVTSATASRISSEVVLHVPTEYDFRFQTLDKDDLFQSIVFLKKKAGKAKFEVRWVYEFFLGDYTKTREDAMVAGGAESGQGAVDEEPPAPLKSSTLAVERAEQYVNKRMSKDGAAEEEEEKDEDEYDENDEGIVLGGGGLAPKKVTLQDFDLLKILGRGAFGKVVQIRKKDTGEIYAMKILKKAMVYKRKQLDHTMAERRILEASTHPFCISLKFAFQNEAKLYLVMDFCTGGELFFQMKKQKLKRFDEATAKIIGAEIVLGLGHLHSKKFIYRDLKPENVLMRGDGHVCLSDFGLAKELDPDESYTKTMCGTPEYLAPEVLHGKPFGTAIDWWAFGCLMYEITTGVTPFHSRTMEELVKKVERGKIKFPNYLSTTFMDFILKLLAGNPKMRLGGGELGVEEVKGHPWFMDIDWDKLLKKEIDPLYVPPEETNFDENKFADEVLDSVVDVNTLQVGNAEDFDGFSYAVTEGSDPLAPEEMEYRAPQGVLESVAELGASNFNMQSVDHVDMMVTGKSKKK
eukprot:TRINITY_DN987_c0_g1_i6.p1 TRINITY_DN987_c0_g1~~TRINITY_DN987_c0_g1_i6.p1  ORF type:complete len:567 (-),score=206.64 TRINITY_DN987_c0_g1_i6:140-1810(-)